MAQGDRAQRQVDVERQPHVLLAERDRKLLRGARQDRNAGQDYFKPMLSAGFLVYVAGDLNNHCILDICAGNAAQLAALEGALDQAAVDANHNERKIRHIAHTVHGAAKGDAAADVGGAVLDRIHILLRGAYKFHWF